MTPVGAALTQFSISPTNSVKEGQSQRLVTARFCSVLSGSLQYEIGFSSPFRHGRLGYMLTF